MSDMLQHTQCLFLIELASLYKPFSSNSVQCVFTIHVPLSLLINSEIVKSASLLIFISP